MRDELNISMTSFLEEMFDAENEPLTDIKFRDAVAICLRLGNNLGTDLAIGTKTNISLLSRI